MDPSRDLGAIAGLIGCAFSGELDERGRAALREMRWMARLSPLVWWMAWADPGFSESFGGFVWEEPGLARQRPQIVGNVSLNRAPGNRETWIVCNVVVQDGWQCKGIGRALTARAIDEARALGARQAVLQVYRDNVAALRLYTSLGLQEAAGETDLQLDAVGPSALVVAAPYHLRAWRPSDGQASYELAARAVPAVLQWLRPVRAGDYRPDRLSLLGERLAGLLGGWRSYRLAAFAGERLVALMTVTAGLRREAHRLALVVDPEQRGLVEEALIRQALHILGGMPPRPVKATVDMDHTAAVQALRQHRFAERRTLLTLVKTF